MASLQTLRNKGGVIVAGVIGVALLSFVLGDLLTSGNTLFGSGQNVGEIDGNKISAQQYQQQVNTLTEVTKVMGGSETITEEQTESIRNEAWEQLIMQYATTPQLAAIGLTVGVDEMADLISGANVSPMVAQLFMNPETGAFDPVMVRQFLQNVDQDPTGRLQMFWTNLQGDVHNQAQIMKFKTIVDRGAYVTANQAKFMSGIEGANYKVRFVAEKLSTVADSTISVSAGEIKDYYNSHIAAYERPESRSIEYVVFDALPSERDYKDAAKYMSSLKEEFEAAADVKQFVSLNSQDAFDARYYKEGELSGDLGTFAFSADKDAIFAPDMKADQYVLARISDTKVLPDSVNFSHILLDPSSSAIADSLLTVLKKSPAQYAQMAADFSLDQNSGAKAGEIGTIDPQALAAEFSAPLMAMKKGEIKIITLPSSIHIVKVNDVIGNSKKVQLGTIKYTVEASEETRATTFNKAANFANAAKSNGFAEQAADSMLSVRKANIAPTQKELQGYANSREAVRWAYNSEKGDLSDVMEFGNSFVIASLSGVTKMGTAPMDAVEASIKHAIVSKKKGEILAAKMNGSVDEVASSMGLEVLQGEDINFTTYIAPEIGFDPAFAGGVTALKEGETSKPIVGLAAVYVVEVEEIVSNPVSEEMLRERLTAELEQNTFYKAYQSMLKNSDITDERYKFF